VCNLYGNFRFVSLVFVNFIFSFAVTTSSIAKRINMLKGMQKIHKHTKYYLYLYLITPFSGIYFKLFVLSKMGI
jgi:hypothetical protein